VSEQIPDFDLYATLGIGRHEPPGVVIAAHRALIRRTHPDLSSDPGSSDRSKRLNIARDWLADPARRARYDALHSPSLAVPADAARNPRSARRRRVRTWERSRGRGQIEVFVARCAYLTRADASRLLAAYVRTGRLPDRRVSEHAKTLARHLGRDAAMRAAIGAALVAIPVPRRSPWLEEVVRLTVLGFAVEDVAPREAATLLGPWRESVELRDEQARKRVALVNRIRRLLMTGVVAALVLLMALTLIVGLLGVASWFVG
jgi:hypothetical protein